MKFNKSFLTFRINFYFSFQAVIKQYKVRYMVWSTSWTKLVLDGEECRNSKIIESLLKHVDLPKECTIKLNTQYLHFYVYYKETFIDTDPLLKVNHIRRIP
jgi:hypothetical protein